MSGGGIILIEIIHYVSRCVYWKKYHNIKMAAPETVIDLFDVVHTFNIPAGATHHESNIAAIDAVMSDYDSVRSHHESDRENMACHDR